MRDSNDYYLGNIQKDGSYSIVPRIGQEVKLPPDGLIAIGQIAKEYGLYTKLTGRSACRYVSHARFINCLKIWEKLINAGFESGHAYGKSLRTVKSCVGSTWCRYGVDDSVGLAIFLENRYKGLRSPHKTKMAVSGCTRECAEAQSKDVGVIATEKGWNLYVCGNGGMKPRDAERWPQIWIRERSSNTSTVSLCSISKRQTVYNAPAYGVTIWKVVLTYLKDVIVHDSLGIAAELERRMQHVIGTYQDQWRTAIEDPEVRKAR